MGFSNFTYVIVTMYFTTFKSVIVSRNTRRPCYVSATFESSDPLPLLRLNGRVSEYLASSKEFYLLVLLLLKQTP